MLLNDWVDSPDGSTFRTAAQETKGGLVVPYLRMLDAAGRWITVNEDMGMPSGKPKTIAVELRFPSASRKVRIVTNLCVYWDDIFLSEGASQARVQQNEVPLLAADLHFRGFSRTRIHPERKQPDAFLYDNVSPDTFWNPTAGLYTRYGDVRELIRDVDDRLAIDRDPNTAFSSSVEPLPFHAMSRYPYPANEHFPDDAEHGRYRQEYNTRPALRLVRPLGGSQ